MARVASFEFYDDPTTHTNPSTCTINWVAQTVTYPGVAAIPFASVDLVQQTIVELADQDVSDLEVDSQRLIYKADGTFLVTLSASGNVVTGLVTGVSPGGPSILPAKAKDLAKGLRDFVVAEL